MKTGYVYIIGNKWGTIYVGVTSDLKRRVHEHQTGKYPRSFSKRYVCHKLLYYEHFESILTAIRREKELKGWTRRRKIILFQQKNPFWRDLAEEWYK